MEKSSPSELNPWQEIAILALTNNFKITLRTSLKSQNKITENITEIDLIKGVKNQLSADNLGTKNQILMKFHHQELAKINDTWQKNRDTIAQAIKILQGEKIEVGGRTSPQILGNSDDFINAENNAIEQSKIESTDAENDDLFDEDFFPDSLEMNAENEESEDWLEPENNTATDEELEDKEEIIYTAEDMEFAENEIDEEDIFGEEEVVVAMAEEATEEDWDDLLRDDEETDMEISTPELTGEWQEWLEEEENEETE